MKRIFIVRHGRTEWNLEERFQGANGDSPLLESSKEDCKDLAVFLDKFNFSRIFTSPIKRARLTAELTVAASKKMQGTPIEEDPGFTEVAFGDWEGLTKGQVQRLYPELFEKLIKRQDDPAFFEFGVEQFSKASQRFRQAVIDAVKMIADGENILIFSHGAISQLGIKALTGDQNLDSLKNESSSILKTSNSSDFILESYNEAAYLKDAYAKGSTTLI